MAMASEGSNEVGGRGGMSPSNGWLSNVVYTASRLSILFNYAFGKPLPKPALPPPVGISENGFMTPRSRGISALYSMACTPYSKVNPTTTMKGDDAAFLVASFPELKYLDLHGGFIEKEDVVKILKGCKQLV